MDDKRLLDQLQGEVLALMGILSVLLKTLREKNALSAEEYARLLDEASLRFEIQNDDSITQYARKAVERMAKARQPPRSTDPQ